MQKIVTKNVTKTFPVTFFSPTNLSLHKSYAFYMASIYSTSYLNQNLLSSIEVWLGGEPQKLPKMKFFVVIPPIFCKSGTSDLMEI